MLVINSPGKLFFIHVVICDRCVARRFDIWKSPLCILSILISFSDETILFSSLIPQHLLPTIKPPTAVIAIYSVPYKDSDYFRGVKTCIRRHAWLWKLSVYLKLQYLCLISLQPSQMSSGLSKMLLCNKWEIRHAYIMQIAGHLETIVIKPELKNHILPCSEQRDQ